MKQEILKRDQRCEVCGQTISAGETVTIRQDYDWDNPDEDLQGSVLISFYRHANPKICEEWRKVMRVAADIEAKNEEDQFRKADY